MKWYGMPHIEYSDNFVVYSYLILTEQMRWRLTFIKEIRFSYSVLFYGLQFSDNANLFALDNDGVDIVASSFYYENIFGYEELCEIQSSAL